MPWFKVVRTTKEDITGIKAVNAGEAEDLAINEDFDWEIFDCEYEVEEIDPVEFGVISREEMLANQITELKSIIRDLAPNVFGLDPDLLERINDQLKVKV